MAAEFHLAENALALHLFLQRLEGLVDIVVTDENLQRVLLFCIRFMKFNGGTSAWPALPRRGV
jgi:hypothetical protein